MKGGVSHVRRAPDAIVSRSTSSASVGRWRVWLQPGSWRGPSAHPSMHPLRWTFGGRPTARTDTDGRTAEAALRGSRQHGFPQRVQLAHFLVARQKEPKCRGRVGGILRCRSLGLQGLLLAPSTCRVCSAVGATFTRMRERPAAPPGPLPLHRNPPGEAVSPGERGPEPLGRDPATAPLVPVTDSGPAPDMASTPLGLLMGQVELVTPTTCSGRPVVKDGTGARERGRSRIPESKIQRPS